MLSKVASTCWPSTAVTASPPLLYGTPTMLTPVRARNSSAVQMRQSARPGMGVIDL